MPVVLGPTADQRVETLNQFPGRALPPLVPDRVVYLGQEPLLVLAGRLQQKLGPKTAHVLAQEVEAVCHMRDAGFLVGEFETPLLQEVCHERLHFVAQKFLRGARDDEVIRIADQVDLVPCALRPGSTEALPKQRLQSIQGRVRQGGRGDAPLRCSFRGSEEDAFFQVSGLQPFPEDDPIRGDVAQQPVMTDPIKAGFDIAFQDPRRAVALAQDLVALV
ncbi:MAG TPA: hypothetical protein VKD72_19630 [Gemmataceae bacterium]|nr:hypothetical protein [Gemmataceae bacterium]